MDNIPMKPHEKFAVRFLKTVETIGALLTLLALVVCVICASVLVLIAVAILLIILWHYSILAFSAAVVMIFLIGVWTWANRVAGWRLQ